MNFKLVRISELSGEEASVYTLLVDGEAQTRFEGFLTDNMDIHTQEIDNIVERLVTIGHDMGARESFFKQNEGKPGDLVCALYDDPDAKLRLYCIRFGKTAVILGGGGPKSKKIRAYQEDPNLERFAKEMITVSKRIHDRMVDREIRWSWNMLDLEGDLDFMEDE